MKRKLRAPTDDYVMPWEDRPCSRERWLKHRDRLMAVAHPGNRPPEWWLYERGREPPEKQALVLYEMGALRSDELAKLQKWWRGYWEEANERFETCSEKHQDQRREFLDWHQVPRSVVQQWDAERSKGNDDAA